MIVHKAGFHVSVVLLAVVVLAAWPSGVSAQDAVEAPAAEEPAKAVEAAEGEQAASSVLDEIAETPKLEQEEAAPENSVEETAETPASTSDLTSFVVAPHVGVTSPQLFSDLGSWAVFGLEFGYIVPVDMGGFVRPLQIGLDVQYTQPGASGSGIDENLGLNGAAYDWDLTQRMLIVELNAAWRFMAIDEYLSAYAQLGPRVYLMESELTATGNGADFGDTTETNTEFGLMVAGGLDLLVGPGSFFGALEMGYSNLDETVTGSANTGALALDLGYRFHF